MRITVAAAVIGILATTPSLGGKVYVDYDSEIDLGRYETIKYVDSKRGLAPDEPMHGQIVENLEKMIRRTRLQIVEDDPDLYATYYITAEAKTSAAASYSGYRYGYGRGWSHYASAYVGHTTVSTWLEGTLVVDVWDAETETLVWRGSATQYFKDKPQKKPTPVGKAFDQMYKAWQKIKKKQGLD